MATVGFSEAITENVYHLIQMKTAPGGKSVSLVRPSLWIFFLTGVLIHENMS